MKQFEEEVEDDENQNGDCDVTTKHLAGERPAGYSNQSYLKCDKINKSWYWYDPTIA